jgi:hypothetical protein
MPVDGVASGVIGAAMADVVDAGLACSLAWAPSDGDIPVAVCAKDAPAPTLRVTRVIVNKRIDETRKLRMSNTATYDLMRR